MIEYAVLILFGAGCMFARIGLDVLTDQAPPIRPVRRIHIRRGTRHV